MTMTKTLLNDRIHLVEGNSKLEGNDDIAFIIFNITSQVTCPYKTAICSFICYATSEERRFPSVRKSRSENFEEAKKDSFVTDMIDHLEYQLNRKKYQNKKLYIRIHSAGDYFNQIYFDKWVEIANFFKDNDNIVFEAYTKSLIYVINSDTPVSDINITLVYSVMPDTKPENVELAKAYGLKTFSALPVGDVSRETFKCPGHCGNCTACYHKDNGIDEIYTEYHGARAKTKIHD